MERINANLKYAAGYVQELTGSILGYQQMRAEGVAKQAHASFEYNAAQTRKYLDRSAMKSYTSAIGSGGPQEDTAKDFRMNIDWRPIS
ncbi:hypothetical protein K493DRAFT_347791 [Basidiobolus meristosporus CBS 931.73]|uniref:Uncharacterized protein n=1 Tax=Basidiobolus meristosporus CBS 931.73 TaxID=1314790 RepID=A0A1Y1YRN9_9FUNG|nr:hypothetical protein K493DRAFT_347791 [Basidiobolus meristosporus CBS 931.73]|eukprot:ORY00629.1 hypothetical protein K493DRAFT_347791 [Basidiobolus meristosporus CBS 931.73]